MKQIQPSTLVDQLLEGGRRTKLDFGAIVINSEIGEKFAIPFVNGLKRRGIRGEFDLVVTDKGAALSRAGSMDVIASQSEEDAPIDFTR